MALGVSRPALTRSLKQLEAELGVALFDRQGVTPTLFGEIVLRHGGRAVADFNELTRELALARSGSCASPPVPIPPTFQDSARSAFCWRGVRTFASSSGSQIGHR